jgi:hypothetical protein
MSTLQVLHILAALVVLAEALNKAERTDPLAPGLSLRARVCEFLKAMAWACLAMGAAGALASPVLLSLGLQPGHISPLLRLDRPSLADVAVLLGFAVLIVRTRVKEG